MKRPFHAEVVASAAAGRDGFAWHAAAILAVALAVRLVHVWQIRSAPLFRILLGDARAYDEWAQQIARGDWLGHEVFYQAPLYPYFLGTLYSILGRDLLIVRVCQAIIGSLACVLLGLAGRRLFSKRAGLIAGLALALYAPAIFFDGLLQKSVLDAFFICLAIWILSGLMVERPKPRYWAWLGLAIGALSLTRENGLVLALVILVWAMGRNRIAGDTRVAAPGMFLLGLSMVLLPVAVRNNVVGAGFHLTTAQFGTNFYIGNNERSVGTYMSLREGRGSAEYERQDATELAERAAGRRLTPGEVSTYWFDQAIGFIRSHPAAWMKLVARKVVLLLKATELADTESQESYEEWSTPVRFAAHVGHFGILLPLALVGLWAMWPQRARLWVLHAMLVAYAGTLIVFYVSARYRYPLVPFLALFAAPGLLALPGLFRATAQTAMTLAAVAAVAVFSNWPVVSADLMKAVTEQNLAVTLQAEGRTDEAIEHYRRAIALGADFAPAHEHLGAALMAQGRVDEAIASGERAVAVHPDNPRVRYNLALALVAGGRPGEAIDHFRLALPSMPDSTEAHSNLGTALAAAGSRDAAIAEFREALRLDPAAAKTHRKLGAALVSQGARADALDYFRRAVQLDPGDGQACLDLASLLLDAGQLDEAVVQFRAVLRLMPDSAEAHNSLGVALASQGRLDEAIDQFQQALTIQPEIAGGRGNLTTALRDRRRLRGT